MSEFCLEHGYTMKYHMRSGLYFCTECEKENMTTPRSELKAKIREIVAKVALDSDTWTEHDVERAAELGAAAAIKLLLEEAERWCSVELMTEIVERQKRPDDGAWTEFNRILDGHIKAAEFREKWLHNHNTAKGEAFVTGQADLLLEYFTLKDGKEG